MDLHVDGIGANLAEPAPAQKHMSSSSRSIDMGDVMHNRHGRCKRLIADKKSSENFSPTVDCADFCANTSQFTAFRRQIGKSGLLKIAAFHASVTLFESFLNFAGSADAKSA